ncbi:MAG: putative amidoligase enzyme [Hyperionvirus sp.]|uniref:Putative amidoligase enzyme n=1 Tax=Hyperionvirus sp. TaxID=2487770 RepID=A0A3G5ADB8_9VIRU|nr:MAG: putative amidoligase enzyme [Hyperionvirus sp.]
MSAYKTSFLDELKQYSDAIMAGRYEYGVYSEKNIVALHSKSDFAILGHAVKILDGTANRVTYLDHVETEPIYHFLIDTRQKIYILFVPNSLAMGAQLIDLIHASGVKINAIFVLGLLHFSYDHRGEAIVFFEIFGEEHVIFPNIEKKVSDLLRGSLDPNESIRPESEGRNILKEPNQNYLEKITCMPEIKNRIFHYEKEFPAIENEISYHELNKSTIPAKTLDLFPYYPGIMEYCLYLQQGASTTAKEAIANKSAYNDAFMKRLREYYNAMHEGKYIMKKSRSNDLIVLESKDDFSILGHHLTSNYKGTIIEYGEEYNYASYLFLMDTDHKIYLLFVPNKLAIGAQLFDLIYQSRKIDSIYVLGKLKAARVIAHTIQYEIIGWNELKYTGGVQKIVEEFFSKEWDLSSTYSIADFSIHSSEIYNREMACRLVIRDRMFYYYSLPEIPGVQEFLEFDAVIVPQSTLDLLAKSATVTEYCFYLQTQGTTKEAAAGSNSAYNDAFMKRLREYYNAMEEGKYSMRTDGFLVAFESKDDFSNLDHDLVGDYTGLVTEYGEAYNFASYLFLMDSKYEMYLLFVPNALAVGSQIFDLVKQSGKIDSIYVLGRLKAAPNYTIMYQIIGLDALGGSSIDIVKSKIEKVIVDEWHLDARYTPLRDEFSDFNKGASEVYRREVGCDRIIKNRVFHFDRLPDIPGKVEFREFDAVIVPQITLDLLAKSAGVVEYCKYIGGVTFPENRSVYFDDFLKQLIIFCKTMESDDNYLVVKVGYKPVNLVTFHRGSDFALLNHVVLKNPNFKTELLERRKLYQGDVYTHLEYIFVMDNEKNIYFLFKPNVVAFGAIYFHLINESKIGGNVYVIGNILIMGSEKGFEVIYEFGFEEMMKDASHVKVVEEFLKKQFGPGVDVKESPLPVSYPNDRYGQYVMCNAALRDRAYFYGGSSPGTMETSFRKYFGDVLTRAEMIHYIEEMKKGEVIGFCDQLTNQKISIHLGKRRGNELKQNMVIDVRENLDKLLALENLVEVLKSIPVGEFPGGNKMGEYRKLVGLYEGMEIKYGKIIDSLENADYVLKFERGRFGRNNVSEINYGFLEKNLGRLVAVEEQDLGKCFRDMLGLVVEEKLHEYNLMNPVYVYGKERLVIVSLPVNKNSWGKFKDVLDKMKRLYEIYKKSGTAIYEGWDTNLVKYLGVYENDGTDDPKKVPYVVLMRNKLAGNDIVGGYLTLPAKAREKAGVPMFSNEPVIMAEFDKEYSQVYVTPSYQFSANKDKPISFSYYLLNKYNEACGAGGQKGWLRTREISKVFEYMVYNWGYHSFVSSNVMFFTCNGAIEFTDENKKHNGFIEQAGERVSILKFAKASKISYLVYGVGLIYESIRGKELLLDDLTVGAESVIKILKTSETDDLEAIVRSSIDFGRRNNDEHMRSYLNGSDYVTLNKFRNLILKSIVIGPVGIDGGDAEKLLGVIIMNNFSDKYFFIKFAKFMSNANDYLVFIVRGGGDDSFIIFANKVNGVVKLYCFNPFDEKGAGLLCGWIYELISPERTFYDFISGEGFLGYVEEMLGEELVSLCKSSGEGISGSGYMVFNVIQNASDPKVFYEKAEGGKIFKSVRKVLGRGIDMFVFLNKYYEVNKQYNFKGGFVDVLYRLDGFLNLERIGSSIKAICGAEFEDIDMDKVVRNLVGILSYKFLYRDEIRELLGLKEKIGVYFPLVIDRASEEILDIFRESYFGIEIESCFHFEGLSPEFNTVDQWLGTDEDIDKAIDYFNKIGKMGLLPSDKNKAGYNDFVTDVPYDQNYSRWRLHQDQSINCHTGVSGVEGADWSGKLTSHPIEIVTPILNFGDNVSGLSEMGLEMKKKLFGENFGRRYTYMNGLFFLTMFYNLMLNNGVDKMYKPNLKVVTRRNNSQGMHMHISNSHLGLVGVKGVYAGLGGLKMLHFVRVFAYFEGVIRTFLLRPLDLKDRGNHWSKSIYYSREKYISRTELAEADKSVISDKIYLLLFESLRGGGKRDDGKIAKMFNNVRDNVLVKHGSVYPGAFALRIHNESECSRNDILPNLECKGHIEVRLHHSTDDFAEMYNWALFINLLLTKCIADIDRLDSLGKHDTDEFKSEFLKLVPSFPRVEKEGGEIANTGVSVTIFDKLFDKYIQNNTLKKFYRSRSKNAGIKSSKGDSGTLFVMHPEAIFDSNGEMLKESLLVSLMKAFPLDPGIRLPYDPKEKFEQILGKSVQAGGRQVVKYKIKYLGLK